MANPGEIDTAEETVRLLAALIRMQTESQSEAILELHRAGIGTTRIAALLGTTKGTANVAIQRSKKKPSRGKKSND
jgi:DNA-directed RNA polymerase specialized sigma24 family protein